MAALDIHVISHQSLSQMFCNVLFCFMNKTRQFGKQVKVFQSDGRGEFKVGSSYRSSK